SAGAVGVKRCRIPSDRRIVQLVVFADVPEQTVIQFSGRGIARAGGGSGKFVVGEKTIVYRQLLGNVEQTAVLDIRRSRTVRALRGQRDLVTADIYGAQQRMAVGIDQSVLKPR